MEGDSSESPTKFSDYIFNWLHIALDYGITEVDFWNMTMAELQRAIDSKVRVKKIEAQEKASYDYILAQVIARDIWSYYSESLTQPTISEVYPSLFESDAKREAMREKKAELSALRFKLFAESYNKKYTEEVANKDE